MKAPAFFESRNSVVDLLLFSYALGVASLVCIHMPIILYSATVLLLAALLGGGYALWRLSTPSTKSRRLMLGLALCVIVVMVGLLYAVSSEIAAFGTLKVHSAVTPERQQEYRMFLLTAAGLYTAASAAGTFVFNRLFSFGRPARIRTFLLLWSALRALFILMSAYGLFLPLR